MVNSTSSTNQRRIIVKKMKPHTHEAEPVAMRAHLLLWHNLGEAAWMLKDDTARRLHEDLHERQEVEE